MAARALGSSGEASKRKASGSRNQRALLNKGPTAGAQLVTGEEGRLQVGKTTLSPSGGQESTREGQLGLNSGPSSSCPCDLGQVSGLSEQHFFVCKTAGLRRQGRERVRGREGRGEGEEGEGEEKEREAKEERKRGGGREEGRPRGHAANHWPAWDLCLSLAPPLLLPHLLAPLQTLSSSRKCSRP